MSEQDFEEARRIAGLFELAPRFYQLRGFDLSNMQGRSVPASGRPLRWDDHADPTRELVELPPSLSREWHCTGRHEPSADAALLVDREALDQLLRKPPT